MIQINNLTKIYKSKKKNSHKALDNINLVLPDTGLVFVIGKSGSGKSTSKPSGWAFDWNPSGRPVVFGYTI